MAAAKIQRGIMAPSAGPSSVIVKAEVNGVIKAEDFGFGNGGDDNGENGDEMGEQSVIYFGETVEGGGGGESSVIQLNYVASEETEESVIQYPEPIKRQRCEEMEVKGEGDENADVKPELFLEGDSLSDPLRSLGDGDAVKYFCNEAPSTCSAAFKTRKSLRNHKLLNHGSFHCLSCKFSSNSARTLGEHGVATHSLRIRKSEENGEVLNLIYCFWSSCNCKAVDEELIILHVIHEHLQLPLSKLKREYLMQKQAQHFISDTGSIPISVSTVGSFYKCFYCDKNMQSIRSIIVHEVAEHSDKLEVAFTTSTGEEGEDEGQIVVRPLSICSRPGCNWNSLVEGHVVLHILKCHETVKLMKVEEVELNAANEAVFDLSAFTEETTQATEGAPVEPVQEKTGEEGEIIITSVTGGDADAQEGAAAEPVKSEVKQEETVMQLSTTEDKEGIKIVSVDAGSELGKHFPCSLCRLRARTQATLFRHLSKVHNLSPPQVMVELAKAVQNPLNSLKCPRADCNATFLEESQLVAHEVLMHRLPIVHDDVFRPV